MLGLLFFGVVVIIFDRTFVTKSINAAIGMLFDSLILAHKLRVQVDGLGCCEQWYTQRWRSGAFRRDHSEMKGGKERQYKNADNLLSRLKIFFTIFCSGRISMTKLF